MREINAPMRNSKLIHVEVVKNDISIKEVVKNDISIKDQTYY